MYLPPSTLFLLVSFSSLVVAANSGKSSDGACSQTNYKLQLGSYALTGDCDSTHFCDASGRCKPKGCRRDEFPLGYSQGAQLPPRCKPGQFCPDEEDACQEVLPVGSPCQLNRDDQCAPPPNSHELTDKGANHNGSVCINFQCMFANVTDGHPCIVEQMPYIAYGTGSNEFIYVVSRGNCRPGLYCDASSNICKQSRVFGQSCTADKECQSDNCLPNLTCGVQPQAPKHFATWVFVVVGFGILFGMLLTLVGLYLIHRRAREHEREKRIQYWREQNAFRQNILQMKDTAKASLLSLTGNDTPSAIYGTGRHHTGSADSSYPMLRRTSQRDYPEDDDQSSIHGETPMTMPLEHDVSAWGGRDIGRQMSRMRR